MQVRMTQEILDMVRKFQRQGIHYIMIARIVDMPITTLNNYCNGKYKDVDILSYGVNKSATVWTPYQTKLLKQGFAILPYHYGESVLFFDLCKKIGKEPDEVRHKITRLCLSKADPFYQEEERRDPIKRPPTVYTNLHTPYGIADELHHGNRIY